MGRMHQVSTIILLVLGTLHTALTGPLYRALAPEAVWFAGTGLGLVLLGALNWAVRRNPAEVTARRVCVVADWVLVVFGVAAVIAVPEPQAFVVLVAALGAAIGLTWTEPRRV